MRPPPTCTPHPSSARSVAVARSGHRPEAESSPRPFPGYRSCPVCIRRSAPPRAAPSCVAAANLAAPQTPPPHRNSPHPPRGTRCSTATSPGPSSAGPSIGPVLSAALPATRHPSPLRAPSPLQCQSQNSPALPLNSAVQSPFLPASSPPQANSRRSSISSTRSRLHPRGIVLAAARTAVRSRRWQYRRPFSSVRAFLHFHFAEQHRRSHRRHRHAPALCAANSVEHVLGVARCNNPRQRRQRRPHNIHAAHQLVRPSVGVHLINNHRQHLKRLRQRPRRQRKSALNVVEVQSIRLPLLLRFINQHLPQLRLRNLLAARHNQIPLSPRRHQSRLIPAVPVRLVKSLDRHPRRQKILQHSILNHHHALGRRSFVVELVAPRQLGPVNLSHRRVVHHAQKLRQHFLPDLLRKRLSFFFIPLPVSFHPVPQHFVKKYRRRPPAQQRGPVIGLRHRRLPQLFQIRRHLGGLLHQHGFAWQSAHRRRLKSFHAEQLHSVVRARLRLHHQPRRRARCLNRRAFARHHPRVRRSHLQNHLREIHITVFPERPRHPPDLILPSLLVKRRRRQFLSHVNLRVGLRKIRRLVLFFRLHGRVRLHIQIRRRRALILPVGQFPEHPRCRVRIILQRQSPRSHPAPAALPMRVIQVRRAHAHRHIRVPPLHRRIRKQRPIRTRNENLVLVINRVAQKIRSRIALRQIRLRAIQLRLHRLQHRVRRRLRRRLIILARRQSRQAHQLRRKRQARQPTSVPLHTSRNSSFAEVHKLNIHD